MVLMKNCVCPGVHAQPNDGLKDPESGFSKIDWTIVLGFRYESGFVQENEAARGKLGRSAKFDDDRVEKGTKFLMKSTGELEKVDWET